MRRVFPNATDPLTVYIDRLFGVVERLRARAWRRSRVRLAANGFECIEHARELAGIEAFLNRGMVRARMEWR